MLAGFNDLATLEPAVAAQGHPTLNGTLTPQQVTAASHKRVWWECPSGHVWKAVIYSRASGKKHGCPICSGTVRLNKQARYAAIKQSLEKGGQALADTDAILTSHAEDYKKLSK